MDLEASSVKVGQPYPAGSPRRCCGRERERSAFAL